MICAFRAHASKGLVMKDKFLGRGGGGRGWASAITGLVMINSLWLGTGQRAGPASIGSVQRVQSLIMAPLLPRLRLRGGIGQTIVEGQTGDQEADAAADEEFTRRCGLFWFPIQSTAIPLHQPLPLPAPVPAPVPTPTKPRPRPPSFRDPDPVDASANFPSLFPQISRNEGTVGLVHAGWGQDFGGEDA